MNLETKRLPARANVKFGVGGRRDARMTHIVSAVAVDWHKGRPVSLHANWLCGSYATRVRLCSEPAESMPLCPSCEWADMADGPFVYVAERDGRIKIGFSAAPVRRARQLHAELLCSFPGTLADERGLHHRFEADRIAGEWFRPSASLRCFIAELQARAA